jgi:hypothetical protein
MTDAALAQIGYTWLSAPGAAALAVLFIHANTLDKAFAGALRDVSHVPKHLWLPGPQGATLDEVVAARVRNGVVVTCHGGPASRRAIEAALRHVGIGECQPPRLWSDRTRLSAATEAMIASAHGRVGVATVLAALESGGAALRALLATVCEQSEPTVSALEQGKWLVNPPRVQLWGPANAGKSSQLNALCGADLAAVADEPGLTRDVIEGRYEHNGFVVRVFDAPGELADARGVEEAAIELARRWKGEADLVLRLTPAGSAGPRTPGEWVVQSRADESATRSELHVSVREPETIKALKDRIDEHFIGRLRALPLDQRIAPVPELIADLRDWLKGRISSGDVESRWLAEAAD